MSADAQVAKSLCELEKVFPGKKESDLKVSKFHKISTIMYYIRLFGSTINLYDIPSESHHKCSVEAPGGNTQQRVGESSKQVTKLVYKSMIFEIANTEDEQEDNMYKQNGSAVSSDTKDKVEVTSRIGKYKLSIINIGEDIVSGKHVVDWDHQGNNKNKAPEYALHTNLLRVVVREISTRGMDACECVGYTDIKTLCDGLKCMFRGHPWNNKG